MSAIVESVECTRTRGIGLPRAHPLETGNKEVNRVHSLSGTISKIACGPFVALAERKTRVMVGSLSRRRCKQPLAVHTIVDKGCQRSLHEGQFYKDRPDPSSFQSSPHSVLQSLTNTSSSTAWLPGCLVPASLSNNYQLHQQLTMKFSVAFIAAAAPFLLSAATAAPTSTTDVAGDVPVVEVETVDVEKRDAKWQPYYGEPIMKREAEADADARWQPYYGEPIMKRDADARWQPYYGEPIMKRDAKWQPYYGEPIMKRDAEADAEADADARWQPYYGEPIMKRDADAEAKWQPYYGEPIMKRDARWQPYYGEPIMKRDADADADADARWQPYYGEPIMKREAEASA
ncbi:hypothetical protein G7K_1325-t1 [Saitoella complicata NRRL Y-17804]|uniref:Uncharacterized protein n=2 Tax=Saitoella complicata (strain BCRC 22490 / CBS 7301 / JCM 7358 / NBRC 10748 / NRRL Y-17804) TaxID=698492 RepID=A0A0E9NB99_SAICN|nr:hypothetical protein G7K_1325-t1 [Saitoella complicata NRRL Y-17804]